MSTEHADRRNPQHETSDGDSPGREPAERPNFQERAREAPLTDEAKTHLRAAGALADKKLARVRSIIMAALHPLVEANRQVGADLTLSDDEVFEIVEAVRAGLDYAGSEVVSPIFARLRGEAPYVRRGPDPETCDDADGETLDREEIDALALDLARIGEAASMADFRYTEDQLRTAMRAAGQKVDDLIDRLYAKAGVTVDDGLLGPLHEEARQWRDGLLDEPPSNLGRRSDDPPAPADTLELPRELVERLVRQVGLLEAADCTLIDMSPRNFVDMEVARRTAREYASRLRGTLRDLEERLGYGDGDALTDRLHLECKAHEAAKRRELAEELEGGD